MHAPGIRRLRAAAVGCCLLLGGCLTNLVLGWTDPDRVPDLATTVTRCEITAVRVDAARTTDIAGDYALALRPLGGVTPKHLAALTTNGPTWLVVTPAPEFPAARELEGFTPLGQAFDVFDGRHLRRRTNTVRRDVIGTVPRAAVARELAADELPTEGLESPLQFDRRLPIGPLHRTLSAVDAQDWLELATGERAVASHARTFEPAGFVDAAGRPLPTEELADALIAPADDPRAARATQARLVIRVHDAATKTAHLVAVPVPVLLNADDLRFVAQADSLLFRWSIRGNGRFVRPNAVPTDLATSTLPLVHGTLDYEWSVELPTDEPLLTAIQYVLLPFTALFDFIVESNPGLRALRDLLFPPPPPPVRPRRGN